jgi:lysophospholipase L1-like esterase
MRRFLESLRLVPAVLVPLAALAADPPADNTPPPGFTALFNGKDLSGWKGLVADPPKRAKMSPEELARAQEEADGSMREHWKVEDGVLAFDGKGQSLVTSKDYGDFELFTDWKIAAGGDSGIYVRGSPQIQIWDRPEGSGGLFNNEKHPAKPLEKADRPPGEWNTFRIIMTGERVTVYLNGALVVNDTVLENYWEREKPIYPAGAIELQNHESPLWFKNIYVKELPRKEGASYPPRFALARGARVAIAGDSITEQKLYSRFIEDYLVACASGLEVRAMQFGWGGERAPGFSDRLENDVLPFRPTVVTTCYGMNDGSYRPYEPPIGEAYGRAMRQAVARLREAGAAVVVGSPGAVDTYSFKMRVAPADYNANLARLRDIARDIAIEEGFPFANVHDAMIGAMKKAKAALGEAYDVCGADGFHPQANGHVVMAYAFLKAMGFDGLIGRITADMNGAPVATEGHTVTGTGGKVDVESSRYPFCFYGDEKSPSSARSILPFVPFHDELNRFVLQVKNLGTPRAKVSWGEASKSFSKEELEAGVNLAKEFPENPFSGPFREVDEVVARKQAIETPLVKDIITRFRTARQLLGSDAEGIAAMEKLRERLLARVTALQDEARAAVKPVRHTITVTPEG